VDMLRLDRLSRISALAPVRRREPVPEACPADDAARVALLGASVGRNRYGEHLIARQWYATPYATPEMCDPDARALRLLLPPNALRKAASQRPARGASDDAAAGQVADWAADPAKWLFLDIETTGLAGGTGTYAFLVGMAWWDGGGITVEQLFMRDHGEEHSILLEIAGRVRERPVLVTFNGKSFDWPLLETRFRMTRAIDPPRIAAHLDMLHPARQLWRLKVGSARLAELEERVLGAETLGWSRNADIDSSRIPEFYFSYLRGGPAKPLAGVFRHNRWDLRGLAALAGRIFRSLAEPETIEAGAEGALELYGVSRLLYRRGERERAQVLYERALAAGLPRPVDRAARHELARLVKRERNYIRAAELWHELADDTSGSFEACEQLAIHYERRAGDPREAARLTRFALGELRRAKRLGLIPPHRHEYFAARFERRLTRLATKLARNT
jgi:uncharacterized protein YprB with RNaseH-like and TPR domain